jgi:hypothetical protein
MAIPDLNISSIIERLDLTEDLTGVTLGDDICAIRKGIKGRHGAGRFKVHVTGTILLAPPGTNRVVIKSALYDMLDRVVMIGEARVYQSWDSSIFGEFQIFMNEYDGNASKIRLWVGRLSKPSEFS